MTPRRKGTVPDDPAVADLVDESNPELDRSTAVPTVSAHRNHRDHHLGARIYELHRLPAQIPPSLFEVPVPLPHPFPPSIGRAVGEAKYVLTDAIVREILRHGVNPLVVVGAPRSLHDLDVFLRHRPLSISQAEHWLLRRGHTARGGTD